MENPKISVIVPVYKVEPYLRKCLDSIVNQTYCNLEIILVDDGSPDNCGAICDEYAARDQRITVIHKENGGVSSARNAGLAAASGGWIGWVDPDDWVEPDMFEYLLGGAVTYGADIAVCGRCVEEATGNAVRTWDVERGMDRETALGELLRNDVMQNFLWDKLWKRELLENIRFPEGRTYEDVAVMHRLFEQARCVACLPQVKYHYVQRKDSIVGNASIKNRVNYYLAAQRRCADMKDAWPQFRHLLEGQCVASAIGMWCSYLQNSKEERQRYWPQILEASDFARTHGRDAVDYLGLGLAGKMVIKLMRYPRRWAFGLAFGISKLYQVRHGHAL